jgi:hypothetical protein
MGLPKIVGGMVRYRCFKRHNVFGDDSYCIICLSMGNLFLKKKIIINSDNKAVVEILNSKTSKSVRVIPLVRYIVYWSLLGNFHIKGQYVPGCNNVLAYCISRETFQKFKDLAMSADTYPAVFPVEFWSLLCQK